MFKKLLQKFNVEITNVQAEDTHMPTIPSGQSYYKYKYCSKCGCALFTEEIMCPNCLNPVV